MKQPETATNKHLALSMFHNYIYKATLRAEKDYKDAKKANDDYLKEMEEDTDGNIEEHWKYDYYLENLEKLNAFPEVLNLLKNL